MRCARPQSGDMTRAHVSGQVSSPGRLAAAGAAALGLPLAPTARHAPYAKARLRRVSVCAEAQPDGFRGVHKMWDTELR